MRTVASQQLATGDLKRNDGEIVSGQSHTLRVQRTYCMKPTAFLRSIVLVTALTAFTISSGVTSGKNEGKRSGTITKAQAERIALTKVPGGRNQQRGTRVCARTVFLVRLHRQTRIEKC
jgi:hypothetical protein